MLDCIDRLTPRQRDVLALSAAGRCNTEIAFELSVAPETVKAHLTGVFRALGVDNRTQAAVQHYRHGLDALTPHAPSAIQSELDAACAWMRGEGTKADCLARLGRERGRRAA